MLILFGVSMNNSSQSSSFSDVDRANNPQFFVNCLEEQYAKNRILQLNKARTLELADIRLGHFVLDAGCGIGKDVVQMATLVGNSGHVLGVGIEPLTRAYTNYNEKKVSSPYLEEIWMAQEQGIVTKEEAERWATYLREAIENDRFMCLQTYVITTGFKHA